MLATLAALLFRLRGVVLGAVGVAVAVGAQATAHSLLVGLPALMAGLGLRAWAFSHLGPGGRTRDPSPPASRATTGPYRWLRHPVYVGNLLVAAGLLLVARLPPGLTATAASVVVGCYGLLAWRESRQLDGVPARRGVVLRGEGLVRSERSTWLSVALLLATMAVTSS